MYSNKVAHTNNPNVAPKVWKTSPKVTIFKEMLVVNHNTPWIEKNIHG
jgi:hypothetical protein